MLSETLVAQLKSAASQQNLNVEQVVTACQTLLGDDICLGSYVWEGPGVTQDELILDVWMVGEVALYVYSVLRTMTLTGMIFYDQFASLGLAKVDHKASPLVLVIGHGEDAGKVFGKLQDEQRLTLFMKTIAKARITFLRQAAHMGGV